MAAVDHHLPAAYTPSTVVPTSVPTVEPEASAGFKECSVRGCHQMVPARAHAKMCEGCRSRHRVYASTKRRKRKLEKAALQHIVGEFVTQSAGPSQQNVMNGSAGDGNHIKSPASPSGKDKIVDKGPFVVPSIDVGISGGALGPGYGQGSSWPTGQEWDSSLDPHLLPAPASASQSSSSSELANALTLRNPSPSYREDRERPSPETTTQSPLQATVTVVSPNSATESLNSHGEAAGGLPSRYCSVKGCKAIIPGSYEFKMCPPCRNRYRGYGTTKRRKWKTERDAFDRDLVSMRTTEDKRRHDQGLPPMADDSEELRLWEMSILDEQIPLPAEVLTALEAAGIRSDGKMNIPSVVDSSSTTKSDGIVEHFAKVAREKATSGEGSGQPMSNLSARMCTVSHCHKILPGYYRYKRCEQHRLQNRHHSKLKRVREKVVKALGPDEGAQAIPIDPILLSPSVDAVPEGKIGAAGQPIQESPTLLNETTTVPVIFPPEVGGKTKKTAQRSLSCATEGCQNVLLVEKRWKRCDPCRLDQRRTKADERRLATRTSSSAQHEPADIPETATDSTISSGPTTDHDHHDGRERANHVSLSPARGLTIPDPQASDERQRSRLRQTHGDVDMGTEAILKAPMKPNVERNSHNGQPLDNGPRRPFNPNEAQMPSNSDMNAVTPPLLPSTAPHQRADAGLRMVNITAHAYQGSQVPFSWANATAGAKASDPTSATSIMTMSGATWGIEVGSAPSMTGASDDISRIPQLSRSSLTFKEYHPPKELSKVPPVPKINKFLARHRNVTLDEYKTFLETLDLDVREQRDTGGSNRTAPTGTYAHGVSLSTDSGPSEASPTRRPEVENSPAMMTGSSATSNSSPTMSHVTTSSTGRLDIPRAATSTAESFRYYHGPYGSHQAGNIFEASADHAGREQPTPVLSVPEITPQTAAKPTCKRKRKSPETASLNKVETTSPAPSIPTAPSTHGTLAPHHQSTNPAGGYPAIPVYLTHSPTFAYPYMYGVPPHGQGQAAAFVYPMWIPAGAMPYLRQTQPFMNSYTPPLSSLNIVQPADAAPSSSPDALISGEAATPQTTTKGSSPMEPRTQDYPTESLAEKTSAPRDTRFAYYHPGIGTSHSPDADDAATKVRKKRRTVDPAWLEKMRMLQVTQQRADLRSVSVRGPSNSPSIHVFRTAGPKAGRDLFASGTTQLMTRAKPSQ